MVLGEAGTRWFAAGNVVRMHRGDGITFSTANRYADRPQCELGPTNRRGHLRAGDGQFQSAQSRQNICFLASFLCLRHEPPQGHGGLRIRGRRMWRKNDSVIREYRKPSLVWSSLAANGQCRGTPCRWRGKVGSPVENKVRVTHQRKRSVAALLVVAAEQLVASLRP